MGERKGRGWRWKHLRRGGVAACTVFLVRVFALLPRAMARGIGASLAALAWQIARGDRRRAERNLELAFGAALDARARRRTARAMFHHFGVALADVLVMQRMTAADVLSRMNISGWREAAAVYDGVLAEGKGLIALTGHVGNWELFACLGSAQWPGRVACVGRRYEFAAYNRIVEGVRRRLGVTMIYQDDSPRAPIRVLGANGLVGILCDQDVKRVHGVFIDFFGRPAHTPSAPANLCLRVGSPIVPLFILREGAGYRVIVSEPIRPEHARGADDPVVEITRRWSKAVEDAIRERPEQWVWTHRRWHTTPEVLARRRELERLRHEARVHDGGADS